MPTSSPLRGIAVTQPGHLYPSKVLSHPPEGCCLPRDPQCRPEQGSASLGKEMCPLPERLPIHPPRSWGVSPVVGPPVWWRGERVCWTRRSCAARGASAGRRLKGWLGRAAAVYTARGAPVLAATTLGRAVPRSQRARQDQPDPPVPSLQPLPTRTGGLSPQPRLGSGPARSVSVCLSLHCPVRPSRVLVPKVNPPFLLWRWGWGSAAPSLPFV